MASSIFLGTFATSSGTIVPTVPIAFPDGAIGAPAITWANALTSGFYRNAANDFRWSTAGVDVLQIGPASVTLLASGGSLNIPSGGSFGAGSSFFLTGGLGTGIVQIRNATVAAGFCLNVNTDGVMVVRDRTNAAFGSVDALGYKVSGVAGAAAFGPSAVASITVVNGLITAIS